MAVRLPQMKLDCRNCDARAKLDRGCDQDSFIPDKWPIPGHPEWEAWNRCPLKMITPDAYEYIAAYNMHKSGILPNGGGYLDHPAKMLEAFGVIREQEVMIAKGR